MRPLGSRNWDLARYRRHGGPPGELQQWGDHLLILTWLGSRGRRGENSEPPAIEAAAFEFAPRWPERANINEISVAAGLQGTVYNYFDSKEDLFLVVIEEATERAAAGATMGPPGAST